ncbi:efflux transporter outer membrane subunit [Rhodocyclus gracilis]|uniref:Efflux transporter outer membrane subunit n=1 Tax=Rhodocyclus tenuis TaxID=1066 RepID=A0A6L5JYE6_RHOTE|nr:efflux transporter outer membrane subunit [Rhodocyclus gracilis]MQY52086.1 efflux transporter outer membrane subunit [Rhodocyclus gracilis]
MRQKHVAFVPTWAVLTAALAGCAVGPDFPTPPAPAVTRYTAEALPAATAEAPTLGGVAQRWAEGAEIPLRWWTCFGSPELNTLVDAAVQANPDLEAAEAALRGAQENVLAQQGAYFPSVDAHLMPSRQRIAAPLASPASSGATYYTLHTGQLSIGYAPDVFGANRRQVESLQAQAEAQRFQREAVYLTLTTNIVVAAIQESSLRAQIAATHTLIEAAARQLDLVRRQQVLGQLGAADVSAQEAVLAQARASLPPLELQLAQQRDLLSVLAGRSPAAGIRQRFELAALSLPQDLPVSLPSRLVEQRPDIRAAQAQWHAASAQIGVAKAARLPSFTLTATLGGAAETLGQMLKTGAGFWSAGADIAQPLFRGGALAHRERAAQAAYEQAAAQYRSTVLSAFQEVADTLHAIDADARRVQAVAAAENAASRSLRIAQRQWQVGAVGYPAVLMAQQAHAQSVIALVQAQAARFTDTAALYQALGGDWQQRDSLSANP